MSKLKSLVKSYRNRELSSFLRFLLFKEQEYRKSLIDRIRSWYRRQLFIEQVTEVGFGLKIGPRENRIIRGKGAKIIIGNEVTIYSPIQISAPTHLFPNSYVKIGDRTRIGRYTAIRAAKGVDIGLGVIAT